jgi:hypothetical protein
MQFCHPISMQNAKLFRCLFPIAFRIFDFVDTVVRESTKPDGVERPAHKFGWRKSIKKTTNSFITTHKSHYKFALFSTKWQQK